jgi:hypothetical protein
MRMVITLNEQERQALTKIAKLEVRDPRDQIRYWLRQDAQARGLLPDDRQPETAVPQVVQNGQ